MLRIVVNLLVIGTACFSFLIKILIKKLVSYENTLNIQFWLALYSCIFLFFALNIKKTNFSENENSIINFPKDLSLIKNKMIFNFEVNFPKISNLIKKGLVIDKLLNSLFPLMK